MNVKILFLLLGCLAGVAVQAQKSIKESAMPSGPIVIDGDMTDWPMDWMLDTNTKILYNMANDNDNLYIRLKISDQMVQQKSLLFGLTLYLNPEGTNKRGKLGLGYPIAKSKDELKETESKSAASEKPWSAMSRDLIRDAEMLELIGLDKEHILTPRVGLMNSLEVVISVDSFGDLIYETKIPFKAYRMDRSKISNLGLMVETGRMPMQNTTQKATYYRGQRYSAPNTQAFNPYNTSTQFHVIFKLH